MKIICTQENLRNGLQIVSRIISNSNTLPILNNVLLKTENGLLSLSATNLELAISTVIRCKIESEGSICLPAKTFTDLVNTLPNTNVEIESENGQAGIMAGQYKTKLKTLPSDEFPLIPVVENGTQLRLPAADLKQSLDSVSFSSSTSETQPEISGVLMDQDGQAIKFVATDRYRLAEKTVITSSVSGTQKIILPHKTVIEMSRILASAAQEETNLVITDNQIAFISGDTQIISRLIDGQYPDYQQIVPENFLSTVSVLKQDLANALKASGIFSRGTGSVVMKYGDGQKLQIRATSHDVGESVVELESESTGESGEIILNYRYVLDSLSVMQSENVVIKIVNESSPVIFQPQGDKSYLYLVMPIKS